MAKQNDSDKTGMMVARVILWTVGMYAMAMIFGSMLLQLYGPPPHIEPSKGGPTPYAHRWCVGTLARLHVELQEKTSAYLEHLEDDGQPWQRWKQDWDSRHHTAAELCLAAQDSTINEGYATVGRLGEHYSQAVKQLTGDSDALRHSVLETVQNVGFN